MKLLIISAIFIVSMVPAFSQTIKEMTPSSVNPIDKSQKQEIEFIKVQEKCEAIWGEIKNEKDIANLSAEDKATLDSCSEEFDNYWDILGIGCSWYCGGGQDTASASSVLKPLKGLEYSPQNSHDLSYKTAWIEGVPGYGIGEYLVYHFPPESPRITKIIVANGYVKSEKSWKENSRVKKLKLYIDNKPVAILNLEDTRSEQEFTFQPIGNGNRTDREKLTSLPWWTMKFEILEVYKGEKYDDTAITEIYFDGIDVH